MIIISQDKKAIHNFDNVLSIQIENQGYGYELIVYDAINDRTGIGSYKTEERAKEVLLDIRKTFSFTQIRGSYQEIDVKIKLTKLACYEMPKE